MCLRPKVFATTNIPELSYWLTKATSIKILNYPYVLLSISFFLFPLHRAAHPLAECIWSTASLLTCKSCSFIWLLHILLTVQIRGKVKSTTNCNFQTHFCKRETFPWSSNHDAHRIFNNTVHLKPTSWIYHLVWDSLILDKKSQSKLQVYSSQMWKLYQIYKMFRKGSGSKNSHRSQ